MSKIVTASDVRTYFRSEAKRMGTLSEAAQVTVKEGARGKVHPEAVKKFNSKRRKDARYEVGNSNIVRDAHQSTRATLREAGLLGEKARGPLSPAAKQYLAQNKG
jgi:hypothetical protein